MQQPCTLTLILHVLSVGLKLGPALIKPFLEYFIGNKKQEPMLFNNAVAEVPGISSGADARLRVKALDSPAPAPAPAPVVTTPPAPPVATKPPKSKVPKCHLECCCNIFAYLSGCCAPLDWPDHVLVHHSAIHIDYNSPGGFMRNLGH